MQDRLPSIVFRPIGRYSCVMPKLVDHEKLRIELAARAARLFLRRGYSALGMREIAEQLGLSKGGLYHYFSSKRALFDAAGRVAVARMAEAFSAPPEGAGVTEAAVGAIIAGVRGMDADFGDEVALLTDYLRTVEDDATARNRIADGNAMIAASVARIVGAERAPLVLSLCYGFLLQRVFAPDDLDFDRFESQLRDLLSHPSMS